MRNPIFMLLIVVIILSSCENKSARRHQNHQVVQPQAPVWVVNQIVLTPTGARYFASHPVKGFWFNGKPNQYAVGDTLELTKRVQ